MARYSLMASALDRLEVWIYSHELFPLIRGTECSSSMHEAVLNFKVHAALPLLLATHETNVVVFGIA